MKMVSNFGIIHVQAMETEGIPALSRNNEKEKNWNLEKLNELLKFIWIIIARAESIIPYCKSHYVALRPSYFLSFSISDTGLFVAIDSNFKMSV